MKINFKMALLLIVIALLFVFVLRGDDKPSLQKYANKALSKCARSDNRAVCYEEEIPKLNKFISMEDSFEITSLVQDKDKDFVYCHTLGHKLAGLEVSKDPDAWKVVAARCPVGVCSNGCLHGAFQEKFREEYLTNDKVDKIKGDLENICEKREGFDPSDLEQASCYHALGHLFMYITNADINKSVALCDELAIKNDGRDFRGVCFDGSFMQIFQPLEDEDISLVAGKVPKKEEIYDYCFMFKGEKRYSCWTESWPLTLGEDMSPERILSFCLRLDLDGQENCFR